MSYSLLDYMRMVADDVRMTAYMAAIQDTIRGGEVVLDLGSGLGFFGLYALQQGAKKVYAVDCNPLGFVGHHLAINNGWEKEFIFMCEDAKRLTLPEKVDVIVADLRGALPVYRDHFYTINLVRDRWLKPGGTIIPQQDTCWIALAHAPKIWKKVIQPWGHREWGLNLSFLRQLLPLSWNAVRLLPRNLVTEPQRWATFDYSQTLPTEQITGSFTWFLQQSITLHGIYMWFDSILSQHSSFSSSPTVGKRPKVYGTAFFPFLRPVFCKAQEPVSISVTASYRSHDFYFSWEITNHQGTLKQEDVFSTFYPLLPEFLQRCAHNARPILSEDARIELLILQLAQEHKTLLEIAEVLKTQFSSRFSSMEDALAFTGEHLLIWQDWQSKEP